MLNYLGIFLLSLIPCLSLLFIYAQSPLSMAMLIVSQALMVASVVYMISVSPWFSYLLAMIFLSGMMIIFIYVSSLASNEVSFSSIFTPFLFFIFLMMTFFLKFNLLPLSSLKDIMLNNSSSVCYKIYGPFMSTLTIIMIFYLLIALLVVVKNSLFSEGPLRSKK